MKRNCLLLVLSLAAVLFACKPERPVNPNAYTIGSGLLVLNEGNYQYSNASLTFYDIEADSVTNNLFYQVNEAPLGDVAESMALADGKLYIVVNNSNLIYKVDANTMAVDTTLPFKLTDFYSPREMQFVAPNKAYVSDLYGSQLWIVNPQDMSHVGSIEMGKATEKMVVVDNELFVSNWSREFVTCDNSTVQVVDVNNDVKVADIHVGIEPNTMTVDKNGHVWVLCEGRSWDFVNGESPSLWEIDPWTKTAQKRYEFESTAMCVRANPTGDQLYVIVNNVVRRFDIATMSLSETFRIEGQPLGWFYNMAVEPRTGDIYVTDAKNYMMNGTVYRYSNDGVLLASFEAGMIPSAMLFK